MTEGEGEKKRKAREGQQYISWKDWRGKRKRMKKKKGREWKEIPNERKHGKRKRRKEKQSNIYPSPHSLFGNFNLETLWSGIEIRLGVKSNYLYNTTPYPSSYPSPPLSSFTFSFSISLLHLFFSLLFLFLILTSFYIFSLFPLSSISLTFYSPYPLLMVINTCK